MTTATLHPSLIPAWQKSQSGAAILSSIPPEADLSDLERAFEAARQAGYTHMLIPSEMAKQSAVADLISREDRAWEFTGQRPSLNQTEDGGLSYNLGGCEPLVG